MIDQQDPVQQKNSSSTDQRSNYVGPIADPGLAMLREQVKNIMIPLLIKVFHIKLELQQASSPPSRLQSRQPEEKVKELLEQIQKLDCDLQLMIGWCQSCKNQVQKVIQEVEQESKIQSPIYSASSADPMLQKSFSDAVAGRQQSLSNARLLTGESPKNDTQGYQEKNPWWNRIFKR
jgi:hypothetical protein